MLTTFAASVLTLFAPPAPVHKEPPKPAPAAIVVSAPALVPIEPAAFIPYPFDLTAEYPNSFDDGQCTAFVASKKHIPWSGNANAWDDNARALGVIVSDIPIVGSIAQSDRGSYGHVALVIAVGDGWVLIREQNYDYNGSIRDRQALVSEFKYIWW